MRTAAHGKAQELYNFAQQQGAPLSEFVLLVSKEEAWELLDYLVTDPGSGYAGNESLLADIQKAREQDDPYWILENFQLSGLDIRARAAVLH